MSGDSFQLTVPVLAGYRLRECRMEDSMTDSMLNIAPEGSIGSLRCAP
jgi:hypothetical protein